MRVVLFLLLFSVSLSPSVWGQSGGSSGQPCDTIYLRDGSKIDAYFERFSEDSIHYRLRGLKPQFRIAKARVERLRLRDGRVKEFERLEGEEPPRLDRWQDVKVTHKKEDIARMLRMDNYDVKFNATSLQRRPRRSDMEKGAIVQLQKLAAQKGATHLYIEEMEYFASYGEPPEIRVVASCYRELKNLPVSPKKEK